MQDISLRSLGEIHLSSSYSFSHTFPPHSSSLHHCNLPGETPRDFTQLFPFTLPLPKQTNFAEEVTQPGSLV